jgi:lipoprotein-anchoring transpeptidase ErfK/SrfK
MLFLPFISQADSSPPGFREYKIQKGDLLGKIAPREHWDLIRRVNRIDEFHLIAGKKILVPHDVELAKNWIPVPGNIDPSSEREVVIFLESQYFGAYENGNLVYWGPISSGKSGNCTPSGKFKVLWKSKDYWSRKYDAEMPFAICISNSGYFMHAQALPGRRASHGCIRLLEKDAQKLFEWTKKGDLVTIV